MKKAKFAAQIFILAAAFPVLFISGISYSGSNSHHNGKKLNEAPSIKTGEQKDAGEPVCNTGTVQYSSIN